MVCNRSDNENSLMLCDGRGGRCTGAAHFYCVGLEGVPEGDWFCMHCQQAPSTQMSSQASSQEESQPSVQTLQRSPAPDSQGSWSPAAAGSSSSGTAPGTRAAADDRSPAASSSGLLRPKRELSKEPISPAAELSKRQPGSAAPSIEIPKWISRQGSRVRVDLGGRRISDAAACLLAKVVRESLSQIAAASDNFTVQMHLAGNRLKKKGLSAFLKAVEATGLHVSLLDLARNKLDASACSWLASWLSRQAGGPPEELVLSQNLALGDAAAKSLFESLGSCKATKRLAPLWIEADYIGLKDVDASLEELSQKVPFCLAMDRSVCGPSSCGSLQGNTRSQTKAPQLHLFGILEQGQDPEPEPEDDGELLAPGSNLSAKRETPASQPKTEASLLDFIAPRISGGQAEPDFPFPVELMPRGEPAVPEAQFVSRAGGANPISGSQSAGEEAGSRSRGRGRGRGRGRQGKSVPQAAEPSPEALEREQRHSWASSLGKNVARDLPSQDPLPTPPPSTGLWDLALAEQKAKKRRKKEAERNLNQSAASNDKFGPMRGLSTDSLGSAASQQEEWVPLAWVPKKVSVTEQEAALAKVEMSAEDEDGSGYGALRKVIEARLCRERRLWPELTSSDRRLRRKCLTEQLCQQGWTKYFRIVTASQAGCWEKYLRTSVGHQRIHTWLDRRVDEVVQSLAGKAAKNAGI
eukprot:TRINITY_DN82009_c0_g1_i1.p1 TRINITY_DN82009_c0_g1~~TRINITY_DN82009_c0_g1_i1.p1  ORF type:complete len:709 (-),score=130.18 TRINITY_DN82009_c0_g1_i1:23-2104(-)